MMAAFKVDENLPDEVAAMLRDAGHAADTAEDEALAGEPDGSVAARCIDEQRCLITFDTDFTDIRKYDPSRHAGIIVLRLSRQEKPFVFGVVARVIRYLTVIPVHGRLWVVDDVSVRVR